METNKAKEALASLVTNGDYRSQTARLRAIFPQVEETLKAGVSRAKVLEALIVQGFSMEMKSFESALYRIRKEIKAGKEVK